MFRLASLTLRDVTACGAALRRLGRGATGIDKVAQRLVQYLFNSLVQTEGEDPACALVRLFKTHPYGHLSPELQSFVVKRLGQAPNHPGTKCLALLGSAGIVSGWNEPALSSRFRVIPLENPEAVEHLPMFSRLFRQFGLSLPDITMGDAGVLLDSGEQSYNVFHVMKAEGSPFVPAQEEFVRRYGIQSVLGFGAPLPSGEMFAVILFSRVAITEQTAELFRTLALCAKIALLPFDGAAQAIPCSTGQPGVALGMQPRTSTAQLHNQVALLEQLLTVQEQAAETQAGRLQIALTGAGLGTWDWDIPTGKVAFNHRWADMLGYRLDEIEPHLRGWEQLVHPEDRQRVMDAMSAHLDGRTDFYSTEHRLRTKDGRWKWILDTGQVLLRDEAGIPLRAAGIHMDITVRKRLEEAQARTEEELRQQQQSLEDAQRLAHLGSWEWNIDSGIERWSDEQFRIFGLSPETIMPTYGTFVDALHQDDRERVIRAIEAALAGTAPYEIECRIVRPTGEVRQIQCRGIVHRDPNGRPLRMSGTVQDVTEYKSTQAALRETADSLHANEDFLRSQIRELPVGHILWDREFRVRSWNPAAERIFGYSAAEIIGCPASVLIPDDARQAVDAVWERLMAGDRSVQSVNANLTKSGQRIIGEWANTPLRGADGKIVNVLSMVSDVTDRHRMADRVQQSEERFRQLAEHIDAAFWLVAQADAKKELIYLSPAFESIWGRDRAEIHSDPTLWLQWVHPEDRERVEIAAACQAELPYDEEYRIIRPDGTVRWIRDRCFPIRDRQNRVYRLAGIAQDITASKQMEEAVRASEARYRSLIELSPNAVLVTCDGRIVYANQACLGLVGALAPSQLLKRAFFSLVPPESLPRFQVRLDEIAVTGQALPPMEDRFIRLDGTVIDIEVAAAPISFEGRPAIQHVVTDVTARKRLERALVSANVQLQGILDAAAQIAIVATDTTGCITTFNRGAVNLLGYAAEEMVGKQTPLVLHDRQEVNLRATELSRQCGRTVQGFDVFVENARAGGYDEREWTYIRKNGTKLTVLLTMTALRSPEGTVTGFLAVAKDITQRKQAEAALAQAARDLEAKNVELAQARDEALAAARLKAEFLATMSHEIRTPMNAIIGMTGLLLDTALTEEQREFADTVRRSSDGLLTLVNDILDFSKIEAGKLTFENIAFDLRGTIDDTLELLAEQAQGKGLELVALVDAAVPTAVHGDPGRLRQVLVNLVANSIKFTSVGEVFLHVTREPGDGPVRIRFVISDTGIGIPKEAQERLFQAFTQADSSTTRRFGGTGLGLAICRRLVAQMQGEIGVESEAGKGSTFWFTAELPEATLPDTVVPPSWQRLRGRRILLADPNRTARNALRQLLAAHGIDCHCAPSGQEALSIARTGAARQPFDLALVEIHLPDIDGFEVARSLRSDPATASIRLVILTTVGRRGDGKAAQDLGIAAYLTKPLRQNQLLDCLSLALLDRDAGPLPPGGAAQSIITKHSLAETEGLSHTRLLLVEDNPVNQKVATKMLEKLGYRVDVAGNGQEAVMAFERFRYPLIFMDCQMPEMDGFEATRLIRQREADNPAKDAPGARPPHVPIIAMTANAMQGDRERCLEAGMDDYIAKPIRSKELQSIVETWLGLTRAKTGTTD